MRLPSRDYRLPLGLLWPVTNLPARTWQTHIVKHPLGVGALARNRRAPWNEEGWDRLTPPVITEDIRTQALASIRQLAKGDLRCGVPEVQGGRGHSDAEELACGVCPDSIISGCQDVLNTALLIGPGYAAATEALVEALADVPGIAVSSRRLMLAVFGLWQEPQTLDGLCVMRLGLDRKTAARRILRISRSDGVRAEFYWNGGGQLSWRTTYRILSAAQTRSGPFGFLTEELPRDHSLGPLSETCVVPRPWWESHGD
jgi:hypothetical protein